MQLTDDDATDIFGCHLGLKAKLPGMEYAHLRMREVVDHARGDNQHFSFSTCLNENIHLNLGHISKKSIFVLTGHCANSAVNDVLKQQTHSWPLIDFFRATYSRIHINENYVFWRPSTL